MSEAVEVLVVGTGEYRIRYVEQIASGDAVLMRFEDPSPRYAVLDNSATVTGEAGEVLDVVLVPPSSAVPTAMEAGAGESGASEATVFVKYRGVEAMWRPGRAVLQCESGQAEALLSAVVEFDHYERELRRIEREIADGWAELEQDKALAFDVTPADLKRSAAVGARMNQTFARRIRFARIEPHLYEPEATLPAVSRKLGEELRDKARIETRLETVDGQLEVFEHMYEMSGQRMGEYRAAREEHVLEWVIIVLLAAELVLLLVPMVWKR